MIRRAWPDSLDISYSQRSNVRNRWNTPEFPALYCCCSETVARAVVKDIFRLTRVVLEDLQDTAQPQLAEILWEGEVIDMITAAGLASAGFPSDYPTGSNHSQTQRAATEWHKAGAAGVLCRSASMRRLGFSVWSGNHQLWSELAIYTQNTSTRPSLLNRRDDLAWLQSPKD